MGFTLEEGEPLVSLVSFLLEFYDKLMKREVDKVSDLKRIEDQLTQLIGMVGKNNEMMNQMKQEMNDMLKEIRNQSYVINHHRDKIAKNEEEVSKIK